MTTPEGPAHGNQSEQPGDRPAWGQQPAGGWGDPSRADGTRAWGDGADRAPDPADERVKQPEGGGGAQPGAQAGAWGSPPQQPGVWGGAPGSAWGAPGPAPQGDPQRGEEGWGQPGQPPQGRAQWDQQQWDQQQWDQQQGQPQWGRQQGQPQWGDPQQPGGQWAGGPQASGGQWAGAQPQAPAWAQQPPPGGGWAPPAQAGGWGGQQAAAPGRPWPGQQQWDPQGYPPLPPSNGGPRPSRTPLIIGAVVVALVAVFALLAFVAPGFLRPTVFDQVALQDGVQRVLIDSYQIPGVGEVVCGDPAQGPIAVRTDDEFTCTADVDGVPVPVQVRITSNSGAYEVVRPAV